MFISLALALVAAPSPQRHDPTEVLAPNVPQTVEQQELSARRGAANAACHRRYMGQDYWPQPAIWKVADADTAVYLFGTVHSLPFDFDWLTPQLEHIISDAGLLLTEGYRSSATPNHPPGRLPPVSDRLRGDARALWRGMLAIMPEEHGAAFDALPTWAVARRIDAEARRRRNPPPGPGADAQLISAFEKAGKPVEEIESAAAVTAMVMAASEAAQRRVLTAQLHDIARPRSVVERMKLFHRWARGEPLSDQRPRRHAKSGELARLLLDKRNAAWADELAERMSKPGTLLVAVGAGHFEGEQSLLKLLSERGLEASRVSSTQPPRSRTAWIPMPATWDSCSDYYMGLKPIPPGNE